MIRHAAIDTLMFSLPLLIRQLLFTPLLISYMPSLLPADQPFQPLPTPLITDDEPLPFSPLRRDAAIALPLFAAASLPLDMPLDSPLRHDTMR